MFLEFFFISEKEFIFKDIPIVRNERVLIPLDSDFFVKLGAEAVYDVINREVTVKTKDYLLSNYIQELDWYNFGLRCYISDVRSDYLNNYAYVPLRAVVESLGLQVEYNNDLKTITINRR